MCSGEEKETCGIYHLDGQLTPGTPASKKRNPCSGRGGGVDMPKPQVTTTAFLGHFYGMKIQASNICHEKTKHFLATSSKMPFHSGDAEVEGHLWNFLPVMSLNLQT